MRDLEPEAPVREREDVGDGRTASARVRDHDDLELEPLGRVDREQADGVRALLLGHRIRLLRPDRLLALDEADEALEVRAAELLVGAREPRELPEVGVPAPAVGEREDREVVVVLGQDALAQELERRVRGHVEESLVSLPEGEQEPAVVLRQVCREGTLEAAEHRLPLRLRPDQNEGVVRYPDERRGQHAEERLVVVAVVEEAEIGEEIRDLLLPEVVAARRAEGREADGAQLLLEPLGVGAGGEEHDDLARRCHACVHELAHPPGDVPRLGAAPVDARLGGRRLVGDEQLERVPQRGDVRTLRGLEPLELVAELSAEELVHRREHLGPRPMVSRQGEHGRRGAAPLAKDGDIGMPKAVDRLELVADDEEIGVRSLAQEVEQLGLQPVRVLELVDHDRAKPLPLAGADRRIVAKQVARPELEILEVDRGLRVLGVRVRLAECRQELLQELAVSRGELLERGGDQHVACLGERGRPRPARLHVREREQALGKRRRLEQLQRLGGGGLLLIRGAHVVAQSRGSLAQRLDPLLQRRARVGLEHELASGRAKRRVDLHEHLAEPDGPVRREEPPAVGLVGRAEPLERRCESLRLENERLRLVQHAERGVDAGGKRIGAEHATAEAVDRGDPGAVELEREVGTAPLEQSGADAGAQLAGGPLRVRDHEQRVDVEPVVHDGPDESLDEHGGLARARARRHEDRPVRLDRRALLVVGERRHGRAFLQIGHKSHQCGQSPPCGSCRTSPLRIRSTRPTAVCRASSTASSKSSGSR